MSTSTESIQERAHRLQQLLLSNDPKHAREISALKERLRQMGVPTANLKRVRG